MLRIRKLGEWRGSPVYEVRVARAPIPELLRELDEAVPTYAAGFCIVPEDDAVAEACAVTHGLHPSRFVAVYDRRRRRCIVVASHWPGVRPGDEIPVP